MQKYKFNILEISAVLLMIMAGFGFYNASADQFLYPDFSLIGKNYLFLFLIFLIIRILVEYFCKLRITLILVALSFIITGELLSLFAIVLFYISSVAFGHILSRILFKEKFGILSDFLVGAAGYGLLMLLSAHFPINIKLLYLLVLLLPIIICREYIKSKTSYFFGIFLKKDSLKSENFLDSCIITLIFLYTSAGLLPETSSDGLATHLYIPAYINKNLFWNFDPLLYSWTFIPSIPDMLYTILYVIGGEIASKFINIIFTCITCTLIFRFIKEKSSSIFAKLGIILYLTTPIIFQEAATLQIESVWIAYLLLMTVLSFQEINSKTVLLASYLIMVAWLCKYFTPFYAIPYFYIIFRYLLNKNVKKSEFFFIRTIFILLSVPVIYHSYVFYQTGNPVFPFANKIFQSALYPVNNFNNTLYNNLNFNILYDLIFNPAKYSEGTIGNIGVYWLLFFPISIIWAILSKNKDLLKLIIFIVVPVLLIFTIQSYTRYITPVAPLLICLISITLASNFRKISFIFFSFVFSIILNLLFITSSLWDLRTLPLVELYTNKIYDLNLKTFNYRKIVSVINYLNVNDKNVAFLDGPLAGNLKTKAYFMGWYNYNFNDSLINSKSSFELIKLFEKNNIQFLVNDGEYGDSNTKIQLIESFLIPIAKFGNISLYEINFDKFIESTFKLSFPSYPDKWINFKPENYSDGAYLLHNKEPLVNISNVDNFSSLPVKVAYKCKVATGALRIQLGFHDVNNENFQNIFQVFQCSENYKNVVVNFQVPTNARKVFIQIVAHDQNPILIKDIFIPSNIGN
jgi:hypothetical protein